MVGLFPQGVCNLKDTGVLNSPKVECLRTACYCCDCIDAVVEENLQEKSSSSVSFVTDAEIDVPVLKFCRA